MSTFTETSAALDTAYDLSADVDTGPASGAFRGKSAAAIPASIKALSDQSDRRASNRFRTAFRPACLVINRRIVMGMIRNMSRSGVMIEIDENLREGQRLSYFWDENRPISARVAWSDGKCHGLENDDEQQVFDSRFTYRSVRVPCSLEAEVWVQGNRQRLEVANISLAGMQIRRLHCERGAPVTISMAGIELYNADVRWNDGNQAGIRFAERLKQSELAAILAHKSVRFDNLVFN